MALTPKQFKQRFFTFVYAHILKDCPKYPHVTLPVYVATELEIFIM